MKLIRKSLTLFIFIHALNTQAQETFADQTAPASKNEDSLVKKKPKAKIGSDSETYVLPQSEAVEEEKVIVKAQSSTRKKANLLYSEKAFSEAIPHFEKLLKTDSSDADLLIKLGDCYRLTNNTKGKLNVYHKLLGTGEAKPIHELYYGQALLENDEGEKAKYFFEKYGADSRGKNLASSFGKKKSYTRNADAYSLSLASFNSPHNDMCAVKYNDIIVFASSRPLSKWIRRKQGWTKGDYMNIFATTKDEKGLEKTPMKFMKDLDTKFNDGPVCFNKDLYLIYYTTNLARKEEQAKDGTYKLRILEGEIDSEGLSIVRSPAFNNKEYNFAHPSLSIDGKTIYYASDMDGGLGGMDIYRSHKDSVGEWGPPINMGALINTAGPDVFPFIASNGSLYFSSKGHDGLGGLDIYEAKLKDNEVVRIYNMGEPINSRFDDFGIYLTEDNKTGFISSNRKEGGMDDDIYDLQILREVKRGKDVLIVVKDGETGLPLPNTKLLLDKDTVFTNENGEYITLMDEEAVLKIKTLKEDYFEKKDSISARTSTLDAFTKELKLEKNPKLFLKALITDAKTGQPLEGVKMRITDIPTSTTIDKYVTTSAGDYFKFLFDNRIGDKLTYLIRLEKTGYLERTIILSHAIDKPGEVNLNDIANFTLGQVEVGMDLAKLIDLQPIYFDMGKSVIRPDAALELDKIIEVMNEYPSMFIELGSHTDCRASAAANMKLSAERAKASVDYIVKKGINKTRITAKGYGETRLLNNCACEDGTESSCSEEEHAKNRRTEFIITKLN